MKKTIKEENNRKILESRYLNDNTLLEFVLEGNQVVASIRYVSGVVSGIREITLATMSLEDYANNLSKICLYNSFLSEFCANLLFNFFNISLVTLSFLKNNIISLLILNYHR